MEPEKKNLTIVKALYPFMKLLNQAEGKNKLFALFQYICKFLGTTIIYSIDTTILLDSESILESIYKKHNALEKIEKSISNGRKIFRFLKFVDDLKKLSNYLSNNIFNTRTVFNIIITLFSSFYHILENLVLLSNLGILEQNITEGLNWKTGKNFFSLLRSSFKLISLLVEMGEIIKENWKLFNNSDNISIKEDSMNRELYDKLLKNNEKYYKLFFLIVEALMKVLMRINSLKIEPIFSYLHPMLMSLFGVVYCVCGIIKRLEKINKSEKSKALSYMNKIRSSSKQLINNTEANPEKRKINFNNSSYMNYNRKKSFEYLLSVRGSIFDLNNKLLSNNYYDQYYIEFCKDFPTNPHIVFDYS